MSAAPAPVGFIGLGNIGGPMAKRLIGWAGGLTVCDALPAATEPFAAGGAHVATTPAELAERSTVISIMVRDDAQVTDVLTDPDGILSTAQPGTVVAVHSTVLADTPARLAAICEEKGVHLLDAPVSGGFMGAHEGTLALMIGGDQEAVDLVREPFATFATLVAHLGPVGAGTQAKLARNLITFASYSAVGEAMRLAEAAGIDLNLLGQVVRHSDQVTGGPGSIMVRPSAAPLDPSDGLYDSFFHGAALGEKDVRLAIALGEELGVDTPIAHLTADLLPGAMGMPPKAES